MLKGRKAHLQERGDINHRSLHKEVVNLDVSRKERWGEGNVQAEEMPRAKVVWGVLSEKTIVLIRF